MRVTGPFSARIRKRTKNSERKDHYLMVHRLYDKRTVVQCVTMTIDLTIGYGIDGSPKHVY